MICYYYGMDVTTLTKLGLTESQAKAYLVLMQFGHLTPPELAKKTKETRTNAYKILDRLSELNLVTRNDSSKKITYRATNPVALETLAKKRRDEALEQEKKIQSSLPTLLTYFHTYSEQPGIRFYQGQEGIKEIFNDMLRTRKTIYFIRSPEDIKFYDGVFFEKFKKQRAKLGIKTYALTPNTKSANHSKDIDASNLFMRTWLPKDAYTASAEWNVYGDKLAIISYGKEAIGIIIESPQIADSFRQLFQLLLANKH